MGQIRKRNGGVRKLCGCSRRAWPKCPHPYHFNYKPRGGAPWRFSLDVEAGTHIESRTDAEKLATDIRAGINAGTFVRAADRRQQQPPATAGVTLDQFAELYIERSAKTSGKKTWKNDQHMLAQLRAFVRPDGSRLGAMPLAAITEDDLEAFHVQLRTAGRAASTRNQYVQVLKASFRWATRKGHLGRNPISDASALERTKIAQRERRLVADVLDAKGTVKEPGEERRLLDATAKNPGMQRLIVAALETGCRRGELLGLQWADIDLDRRELRIRAENAKDAETRLLPVSSRLAAILEMAKIDPAGVAYRAEDFVFGECGQRVKSVKRAWVNACARAGITDLHFHDLRHEAGSRLLEAGWPIHHVKDMLGHANVSQTSTYLNAGRLGLQESMKRFDPARCNPVASGAASAPPTDRNAAPTDGKQVTVN